MLSFPLRRVLSHPGIFSIARVLPGRAISSNQSLAMTVQRNLATTATGSTTDSEPAPEPESKLKSAHRKTGSSAKAAGKDKKNGDVERRAKKAEKELKVTISPKDRPPKHPGTPYILWMTDWFRTQPKIENSEMAQSRVKEGAEIWHTVSDYDKQQYQEKFEVLRAEYNKSIEEWREKVDPAVLRELNRRRVAKGLSRIRGPGTGRPMTGYSRFCIHLRDEYPRTDEDHQTHFKALAARASSQWKGMSDVEKAKYVDPAKADFAAWHEKRKAESQAKA